MKNRSYSQRRCGFISLLGKPNVGKSTLLNQLIGENIAIVTEKEQTTWHRIPGILTVSDRIRAQGLPLALRGLSEKAGEFQIIFQDTPGLHQNKDELNKRMLSFSEDAILRNDFHFFIISALDRDPVESNQSVLKYIKRSRHPVFLIVNKIDQLNEAQKVEVEAKAGALAELVEAEKVFLVSAEQGTGLKELVEEMVTRLPESPFLYPEDDLTDLNLRFLVQEFIREQVFLNLHEEVPYQAAVEVIDYRHKDDKVNIHAVIHLERDSQKRMLIGKGATKIKKIGMRARERIESLIGKKVFLDLHAKVKPAWRKNHYFLKQIGFDRPSSFQSVHRR